MRSTGRPQPKELNRGFRGFHGFGILHFAFCILHFLIRVNLRANAFLSQFAAVQKTLLF
jgi:hypothetical protein